MGSTDSQEVRGSTLFEFDSLDGEAGRVQERTAAILKDVALPGKRLSPSSQLWLANELNDRPIKTGGQARTIAGDFAEELTATLTGAKRLKTDSRCLVCPDLQYDDDTFFETKSVGNTNCAIIYECRAKKDAHFIQHYEKQLYYWFWFHRAAVVNSASVNELRADIAGSLHSGVVIDFQTLHSALLGRPTKTLNTAYIRTGPNSGARLGYGSYDYGVGWSVPRKLLLNLAEISKPLTLPRKVYGLDITDGKAVSLNMRDWSCLRFLNI